MINWCRTISSDMTKIPDFVAFFEKEYESATLEVHIKGKSIEKHQAELPGIVEQRYNQLQEIESVLEFLNIKYREERANAFKKFLESYAKSLTSRDADKYCDGDRQVVEMAMLVNEVALIRNRFLALHKGLEQKGWMLGHITKLKCAGLDDATVK